MEQFEQEVAFVWLFMVQDTQPVGQGEHVDPFKK